MIGDRRLTTAVAGAAFAGPAVSAEGFGRRYGPRRRWAVHDVTFEVPTGSITALVGPNGAGKSTLLRACIGFEPASAGRILVQGVDPARDRAGAVKSIGFVPQASTLYRSLTIADHFAIARGARSSFDVAYARQRVTGAGLSANRVVGQLSGGEQAQVALALALATRAPVLLLDEPLASLDPLARRDFLTTLVDDVRARRATAILSSHIVTDVEQACDRLLILAAGRVAFHASVDEAKRRHRTVSGVHPATPGFIGDFLGPEGKALSLIQSPDHGQPANLEEIVLGYLAADRAQLPS
jgi:ABC-2 type transport system ATP-binding protein